MGSLVLGACGTLSPAPEDDEAPARSTEQMVLPDRQTSPAVMDLLERARQAAGGGDIQKAESLLERSVRIEPRNPALWNYMAKLRLEQGRHQEAEGLAAKSSALASGNPRLIADNWRIIAHARYRHGDLAGAREAELRAKGVMTGAN